MSFTIVTGLIDIRRGAWNSYFRRSIQNYFASMTKGVLRYDHPMIVFIDQEYYSQVVELRKEFPNTRIIPVTLSQTYLYPQRERIQQIQSSSEYKSLLREESKVNPEHWCPDYDIVTIQKACWMRDVIRENPFSTDYFVWIDGGYSKGTLGLTIPATLDLSPIIQMMDPTKIFFQVLGESPRNPSLFPLDMTPLDYFKKNDTFISGGLYIAGKASLPIFDYYIEMVDKCLQQNLIDDDQFYWFLCMNCSKFASSFVPYSIDGWGEVFDLLKALSLPAQRKISSSAEEKFVQVSQPRIAVLLTGNIRSWKYIDKAWMKHFNCYAITYPNKYMYHPFVQSQIGTFDKKINPTEELRDFPFKKICTVSQDRDEEMEAKMHPEMQKIYHGYYQYRTSLEAFHQMPELNHYDFVIRTRFDLQPPSELLNNLYRILSVFEPTLLLNSLGDFSNKHNFPISTNLNELQGVAAKSILYPLETTPFYAYNPNTIPSDTVFMGPPEMLKKLLSFATSSYFQPSSENCWKNPPHGIIREFIVQNQITTHLANFGTIFRPLPLDNLPPRKEALSIGLLISGNLRGKSLALPPRYLLTKHRVTLYFVSWIDEDFLYAVRDLEQLSQQGIEYRLLLFPRSKSSQIVEENCSSNYRAYPGICGEKTFGNACSMWYLFEQGLQAIKTSEQKFDLIIRWRPDLILDSNCMLDDELMYQSVEKNCLMMPNWHGKFGDVNRQMMDQLFWGPAELMQKLCLYSSRKEHSGQSEFAHTGEGMLARMIEKEKIPLVCFPLHYGLRRIDRVEKIV